MTADRHCAALVGRLRGSKALLATAGTRRISIACHPQVEAFHDCYWTQISPLCRVISRIVAVTGCGRLDGGGETFLKKARQLTQQCIHQRTQPGRGTRGDVCRISSFKFGKQNYFYLFVTSLQ